MIETMDKFYEKLVKGNGRVLAIPGEGRSFKVTMSAEESKLRYPNEKVVNVNPEDVFKECKPQETEISIRKESDE